MPEYIYIDEHKHTTTITMSMLDESPVLCTCGAPMWRKPQIVGVIWGQPKPSAGGLHPTVDKLNKARPRLKDEFYKKREEHYRRQAEEESDADQV